MIMNNKSIPPFFVGQKIVSIVSGGEPFHTKGCEYIVFAIQQCSKCKVWYVSLGVKPDYKTICFCPFCHQDMDGQGTIWHPHTSFVPITSTFQSIEYREVLENERQLVSAN